MQQRIPPDKQWWLEPAFENNSGLSSKTARARLLIHGPNMLHQTRRKAVLIDFLSRFRNPLVILLIAASAISAVVNDTYSLVFISLMVIMSVSIDFTQERRASRSAEKLRETVSLRANTIRDGTIQSIGIEDLVPGDVVTLTSGNRIPADGLVLEASNLFVNQSLLTGESYPVEKLPTAPSVADVDIANAQNAVFMGTSVVAGTGKILIRRTGSETQLNKIAKAVSMHSPATAFEIGIQHFGMLIMWVTLFLVLFVLFVNTFFHRPWPETLLFAIALAVGLTPELLPMVVSVTLAHGSMQMAKLKVIVKELAAIQNLGSMDILCTDKTGTLTEGSIKLERHVDILGKENQDVIRLAYINSYFETGIKSPLDEAILSHAPFDMNVWKKIDEVPFDFERRRVSVLVENQNTRLLIVKGAPEDLIKLCATYQLDNDMGEMPMDELASKAGLNQFQELSRAGFRVIGIAYKKVAENYFDAVVSDETALTLVGFVAFFDPPKKSALGAIQALTEMGISIKLITGDNELVTYHLCEKLNIPIRAMLNGAQLDELDDDALNALVDETDLYCRVSPPQKSRIIKALKARSHVVGYLGDGINDAPALHSADVGISVGGAVDVAKDASDIIMMKHDLGVLVDGIEEGRKTFANVMKYIMMSTSSNFGNMLSMAIASLFLPFLPMLPIQILLNNFLYDISEMAIPLDRVDKEYLQKPQPWNINFIRNFMLIIGPISSLFDFLIFYVLLYVLKANEALFHTGWFIESIATQVLVIFVIRTRFNPLRSVPHPSLIITSLFVVAVAVSLPFLPISSYLGFSIPEMQFFAILISMVFAYLILVEIIKQWFYRSRFANELNTT